MTVTTQVLLGPEYLHAVIQSDDVGDLLWGPDMMPMGPLMLANGQVQVFDDDLDLSQLLTPGSVLDIAGVGSSARVIQTPVLACWSADPRGAEIAWGWLDLERLDRDPGGPDFQRVYVHRHQAKHDISSLRSEAQVRDDFAPQVEILQSEALRKLLG